jgi:CheY-like chemotaxis protein
MVKVLDAVLTGLAIHIEDAERSAIEWLTAHQVDVDLISLDHDLDSVDRRECPPVDHGCGRPVADFIASREPTCPVIIHTSNAVAGDGMHYELKRGKWPVSRVYPRDHHEWITTDWRREIERFFSAVG